MKQIRFFIFILIFTSALLAQESTKLTLEKSLELAMDQNPDYKMTEKEVDKSHADVWVAYSNILPQVDASANLQHAWSIQESTIPNFVKVMLGPLATPDMPDYVRISFALENSLVYGASLRQPLFLGGAGIAGIKAAYAAERAMKQNLEAKKQDLIYNTADAFYSCILAQSLVDVQEEALGQSQANLEVVKKKHSAGTASGFDKMRAEVEVANLQPAVITARNNYQLAMTHLRTLLGLEKNTMIEVSGELQYNNEPLDSLGLAELQAMALQERPEMLALHEQKIITNKSVVIARSAFLPKLYFSTDLSFMANRNDYNFASKDFSRGLTSALSLQIPLFQGFRSSKEYQKARLDQHIFEDNEKQVRDAVGAEVEVAFNKLHEAREKYQSATETVKMAAEALRLATLMYNEGTNTQLDVLNSQLSLTQARMNHASSLYEYQVARYNLHRVTGTLKEIL